MNIREIATSRLKDYDNNPRNNDLAVEKVKYSIERFGFLFPVIVDVNFVIVAGHTRVRACRELGIQSVPCIVADELTDEQINFFRLVDNKTSEYSDWDFEKLKNELSQIDLTLDKNQILLERFELSAQVFELEPEMAEIKIPSFNFMGVDKPKPPKKPPVSTIHEEGEGDEAAEDAQEGSDSPASASDAPAPTLTSAEDVAQRIAEESGAAPASPPVQQPEEQRKPGKAPVLIQFRFGDTAFFISQVELDKLNAKYTEFIDSGEVYKRSFADYLLEGVEEHD